MVEESPRRTGRRWRAPRLALAVAAAGAVAAAVAVTWTAQASVPPTQSGWTQIFVDDFGGNAGSAPSSANWQYATGHGYPGGATNWGTGEIENMTSSTANSYLDGSGNLAIKPIRDGAGNWTSARLETKRTDLAAPAGKKLRVEGRIQLPNVTGAAAAGYWPAFWMLGDAARPVGATNWPSIGEIDILENANGMSSTFHTLHCGNTASGGPCNETEGLGSGQRECAGCLGTFHTFAIEQDRSVSPEQIRWYRDGAEIFRIDSNRVDATTWNNATHHGFFVILNVAMGGGFPNAFGGGPTAATQSGVPMLVDYVAAYVSGGGTTTPPTTQNPTPSATQKPTPPSGTRDAYATIEAESGNAQSGTQTEATQGGGTHVGWIANGDWLQYDNVEFGSNPARQFTARVASGAPSGVSGLVEVRLDSRSNAPIGSFAIANTGGWQSWRNVPANIGAVTGRHTVFLTFTSGQPSDFVNVNSLTFGH